VQGGRDKRFWGLVGSKMSDIVRGLVVFACCLVGWVVETVNLSHFPLYFVHSCALGPGQKPQDLEKGTRPKFSAPKSDTRYSTSSSIRAWPQLGGEIKYVQSGSLLPRAPWVSEDEYPGEEDSPYKHCTAPGCVPGGRRVRS